MARQRRRTAVDGGEVNRELIRDELIRDARRILLGVLFFSPTCQQDKMPGGQTEQEDRPVARAKNLSRVRKEKEIMAISAERTAMYQSAVLEMRGPYRRWQREN
ncbi:MAG: hypothetical protein F4147_12070 [Gammaproteobacteria bacterium]|nr:hypothetical protein [Gammaproteobacteria bacterium]